MAVASALCSRENPAALPATRRETPASCPREARHRREVKARVERVPGAETPSAGIATVGAVPGTVRGGGTWPGSTGSGPLASGRDAPDGRPPVPAPPVPAPPFPAAAATPGAALSNAGGPDGPARGAPNVEGSGPTGAETLEFGPADGELVPDPEGPPAAWSGNGEPPDPGRDGRLCRGFAGAPGRQRDVTGRFTFTFFSISPVSSRSAR